MIVIAILGVLATLISGNFITSLKKGRDARRKTDLEQIQRALEMYYEDNKAYPLTAAVVFGNQLCYPGANGCNTKVYMQKLPDDPSPGKHYSYEAATDGSYYKAYACLENTQQILPFLSSPTSFTCSLNCKDKDNNNVSCIWGIASSNTNP